MKTLVGFLLVGVLLQVQADTEQGNKTHFLCNVPDEWLFGSNGTQNFFPGQKWPGGIVKYEFHSSLTDNDKRETQRAFADIQSKTCIKFQPRAAGEVAYTSIEVDNNVCGLGHVCRTGGRQFAQFGGGCRDWNTMVHELGHNLCLGHEMSRKDRDTYVHFGGCATNEIPAKDTNFDLRGSLYDYGSQMHYQCGWCLGGWPRQPEASKCGRDMTGGLSVLDADRLNDFYGCPGCNAHRWRPIDQLTPIDRQSLLSFGSTSSGQKLYACRSNIFGEIAIGEYAQEWGFCNIPYGGKEHRVTTNAQVFTWPPAAVQDGGELEKPEYTLGNVTDVLSGTVTAVPVRSGRSAAGVTAFIAVASVAESGGKRKNGIGKAFENDLSKAFFPSEGKELQVTSFSIIVCG